MKSILNLATILVLIFACRICSTTGSRNGPNPSSSPASVSYAADFIKPQLGSFKLVKSYTKEEARKTASGFTVKLIEQSNDAAGGEYKSYGGQSVALMACNYANTTVPSSLVDGIEKGLRNDRVWKTVRAIPKPDGKRVEGEDGRGNGLVIWSSGYWVFMTIGSSLSDAGSLADNVGY